MTASAANAPMTVSAVRASSIGQMGGGLDRLHHQQGGRGDEAGGDGVVAGHVHLGEVLQNRNPHDDLPALHRVGQQKAGYRGAGEGAQDTLDGAVVLCTFRFRDYEKPCKYPS